MDVEAQDDGIMAKVLVPGGSQKIAVGQIIAIVTDEGDGTSVMELEVKQEAISSISPNGETEGETESTETNSPNKEEIHTETPHNKIHLPAVLRLLHEHRILDPSAIPATGPHGRLLKGDVLAYVGAIDKRSPENLRSIVERKQNLDLRHVVQTQPRSQDKELTITAARTDAGSPLATLQVSVNLRPLIEFQTRISSISFALAKCRRSWTRDCVGDSSGERSYASAQRDPQLWPPKTIKSRSDFCGPH
jgi:pyruvate/2-oxoglutarate dehydrogenase complex dihydrolipoamide acyltransferase (E2) component